jgi:hypothetical protein
MDFDTMAMPAAGIPVESEEERNRRLIREAGGMSANRMPPAPVTSATSNAGAMSHPKMPPAGFPEAPVAPTFDKNFMPPANFALPGTPAAAPARPEVASSALSMPPAQSASSQRSDAFPGNQTSRSANSNPDFLADALRTATSRGEPADENMTRLGSAAVDHLRTQPVDVGHPLGKDIDPTAAMRASGSTDLGKMPPAFFSGASEQPRRPEVDANKMPPAPVPVGPETKRFQDISQQERPELHGFKKFFDVLSSIHPLGRAIEQQIPGSPGNFDAKFNAAAMRAAREQGIQRGQQENQKEQQGNETAAAQARFNTPEKRRQYMTQNPDLFDDVSDFEKHDWVLSGKFPQKEPVPPKPGRPENLDREAYDDYVSKGLSPAEARRRVLQDAQDVKPDHPTHTSPFEAFAYGTPQEKRSAQDFLAFEKRMGSQYQKPTEAEFRYSLFQRDPEGYKAVFGDKAATGDRAHATEMLKFFQKQRDAIQKDFMLGDDEKAQKLSEIDKLEKPFMDTARGNGEGGGAADRVSVIHPDGTRGTIPRSQLGAANLKGYRVQQ